MYRKAENLRRTVLVVEDEFVNRQLLGMILSSDYEVLYAENGLQAMEVLRNTENTISMVLTDLNMPEMDGYDLIRAIKADRDFRKIPIIVLTSENDAEIQCLELGAADFIRKPYDMPQVILARVQRIIELSEDRIIIRATEKDPLTGLYTKDYFFEYAARLEAHHPDRRMDAAVLDIDRFHMVNELYGRDFGNTVLSTVAGRLMTFLADNNGIGCRYEQDMFMFICGHRDSYDDVVESVLAGLGDLETSLRFSVRLGINPDVRPDTAVYDQFDRARRACNAIKSNRAKPVMIYDEELQKKNRLSERLIHEMKGAMEEKQFKVFFQPKYNIKGEKPVLSSAEALVRWIHPELGMISPGLFIPLFEQNGLIQILDMYVWEESARQLSEWKRDLKKHLSVSVNVSRIDLYNPRIAEVLLDIKNRYKLDFNEFLLEITESAYSDDTDHLADVVRNLRSCGFMIEMDDFGAGYSSLTMLSVLPVDYLKLDMSFIRRIQENPVNRRMVELVIDMAKAIGTPVVAEGVETEEQYLILKDLGCDLIQGYYFSRPLPVSDFGKLLSEQGV